MRNMRMRATLLPAIAVMVMSLSCASSTTPKGQLDDARPARSKQAQNELSAHSSSIALADAMSLLGVEKNDERILLLTNAGYASPDGQGTQFFADVATEVSGCSIGKGSLHFLHSPSTSALWFAVFRRDTHQATFKKWMDDAFESQVIDARPDLLERRIDWLVANEGPVRGSLFQIISFSNAWAQGADPLLLKCAEFHNHCCGGVTAGYLTGRYIQENLPLQDGERYVFVTASPSCAMDALQVMFDTTAGKHGMFTTKADAEALEEYETDDARPLTLVMRVDEEEDTCDGMLLGFAWFRTNQKSKLWNVAEVEKLDCVRVLKRFSGDASLAQTLAASGTAPYRLILDE